jgi:hypothetical protein
MILNSYAVLVAFVGIVRLGVGVSLASLAGRALCRGRRVVDSTAGQRVSDRFYLLLVLGVALFGLNLLSWPLLYLLLQSYVAEFPEVMCIYGVTRIGEGSQGASRHLPMLLIFLQASKPLVVLVGGAWFVLYLINRRCDGAPLLPRLLLLALPLGISGGVDAGAELTYIGLSKSEDPLPSGCCTSPRADDRFVPQGMTDEESRGALTVAFYGGNAILMLGAGLVTRGGRVPGIFALTVLVSTATAMTAVSAAFLIDVSAPKLLHLPLHHCAYDLLPRVPEAAVAMALYVAGVFCIAWAWVARVLGSVDEAHSHAGEMTSRLLRIGLWCYLTSICMLSIELALS